MINYLCHSTVSCQPWGNIANIGTHGLMTYSNPSTRAKYPHFLAAWADEHQQAEERCGVGRLLWDFVAAHQEDWQLLLRFPVESASWFQNLEI